MMNTLARKRQQEEAATASSNRTGTDRYESHIEVDQPDFDQAEQWETVDVQPEPEEDPIKLAEKVKEMGNAAFRAQQYMDAVESYSWAIDLNPAAPTYLTNRAAAYMALKKFKLALADCQQAAYLQSESPSSKTRIRLARCQLFTGSTAPALSTLRAVLDLEPYNGPALQLQKKVLELEAHLQNFQDAKRRQDWVTARLALDKCVQAIEAKGGDIPVQWKLGRIELELAQKNWDAADIASSEALCLEPNSPDVLALRGLVLFLTAKIAEALQHVQSALRLDPGHEVAQRLRKRIKDVERLKEEGNVAFKAGRLQEATERYGEALDRIGEENKEGNGGQIRAILLSHRATTLMKLEQYEDALQDTEEFLRLYPASFKALRTRARINLHLEKHDSAIADFKSAIEQAGFEGSDADVKALRSELKKAELALKRSKSKDYFKILGGSKEATGSSQRANIGPTRSTSGKTRRRQAYNAGPAQQGRPILHPMPPSEFFELASGTNRSNAVAIVRVRHPELDHTKMDDTELLYWGRYHIAFNGTFHDWLAMMKSKFKYGDSITDSEAMEEVRQHAKAVLDQSIPIIGREPVPGESDVHYLSVPNAQFAVRIWGKGMEACHTYCLDFVDRRTLQHIRTPPSCHLYRVQTPDRYWLPHFLTGRVERADERIIQEVYEGESFMLTVGADTRAVFTIPIRPIVVKPDWLWGTPILNFRPSV